MSIVGDLLMNSQFAMGETKYQICELLINEGAEKNALNFRGQL